MFIRLYSLIEGQMIGLMFRMLSGVVLFLWSGFYFICFASDVNEPKIIETSVSIPYNAHLAPEPVIQIAEAYAFLDALERIRSTFSETSLVRLGVRTRARQLALASAMYPMSIHERHMKDGPEIFIKVRCCELSPSSSEECIRKLIRQSDHLQLREVAIVKLEDCIKEGKDLLDQSCKCTSVLCSHSPSILSQVKDVSNRIKALQLYFIELSDFESTWTKPDQTVLALSEATTFDPNNTLLWLGVGECLILLNRPYEGIKVLQKIPLDSELPARALYVRGMASLQMYLPALAIKDISHALELDPEHPEWWNSLGVAKLIAGETKDMCNDFYQACALGVCEGLLEVRKQRFCFEFSGL